MTIYPTLSSLIFLCSNFLASPVASFEFLVDPSPVGVNQTFEIIWDYVDGDAPNNIFAIEVQGADSYLVWLGFYNSSGSALIQGPPFAGFYTLAAYSNVPGPSNGTFFTTVITVQDQAGPTTSRFPESESAESAPSSTTTTSIDTTVKSSSFSSSVKSPTITIPESSTSLSLIPSFISTPGSPSQSSSSLTSSLTSSASSPTLPSPSAKPRRNNTIIIGISSGIGGLLFFISFGLYYIRRRRKLHEIEDQKYAASPYYTYPQIALHSHPTPALGLSSSGSRVYTRIPPSKNSTSTSATSHARAVPLNRNASDMRTLYNTAPPSYRALA
ncbi:hypothetical protein F5050DRAFT_1488403 [Lentinula boryana]|uniref:Uncharacterized protein n=1 Tax=Lentinula boryana TaxID=40481 RepID=A0ABQ8QEY0_9AGAR|nr:hypothetical protein F5050DRAFT_1488403 [Lentinula boryana]